MNGIHMERFMNCPNIPGLSGMAWAAVHLEGSNPTCCAASRSHLWKNEARRGWSRWTFFRRKKPLGPESGVYFMFSTVFPRLGVSPLCNSPGWPCAVSRDSRASCLRRSLSHWFMWDRLGRPSQLCKTHWFHHLLSKPKKKNTFCFPMFVCKLCFSAETKRPIEKQHPKASDFATAMAARYGSSVVQCTRPCTMKKYFKVIHDHSSNA